MSNSKKKNYLDNEELKQEILNCITLGYKKALKAGYVNESIPFHTDDIEKDKLYNDAVNLGYMQERTDWINKVREYDEKRVKKIIERGEIKDDECAWFNSFKFYPEVGEDIELKECTLTEEDINFINQKNEYLKRVLFPPVTSTKLGGMFLLIVENVSRSFYWANPDDGEDCKANSILDLCSNFWKFEPANPGTGKPFNAFAFCTQIAYFGIAGAHRILHPKKYEGTISMSCLDENGKSFDLYNL